MEIINEASIDEEILEGMATTFEILDLKSKEADLSLKMCVLTVILSFKRMKLNIL